MAFTQKADELGQRLAEVESVSVEHQQLLRLWCGDTQLQQWEHELQQARQLLNDEQYVALEPLLDGLKIAIAAKATWAAGQEEKHQKRLYLLEALRQVCADMGFREDSAIRYEREGDRGSSILLTVNTRDRGVINFTLSLEEISTFSEIANNHQILGEGHLTDSRGQTVFFTETVIIFTSNLGTRTTDSRGFLIRERDELDTVIETSGLDYEDKKRAVREHFTRAVKNFFMFEISRPELLNRIGNNIVPFNYIHTPQVQQEIVNSHLRRIKADFEDKYRSVGHRMMCGDTVAQRLVEKHSERINLFGGRGITNAIEDEVMLPLARAVLRAEYNGQQRVTFRVGLDAQGRVIVDQ